MLSRLWRYLTAPVFDATTITNCIGAVAVTVNAGQKTRICTIRLSLAAEGAFVNRQEQIDFPRPSINDVPGVQVSYGEDRRPSRDVLELDVYVHVTSVGKYSITPEFPENRYYFRLINKNPVNFYIKPSKLQLIKLSSIAPIPGHGKAGSVYRGGTVEIRVTARDEFGNFITYDANFNISSHTLSVTLLSTVLNARDKQFLVKLRCNKVGKGSFDLIASQGNRQVRKDIPLEVIPPPVSAAKSYITQIDIDKIQERIHEAGQAIKFRLALIDILGNPLPSEESVQYQDQFRLNYQSNTVIYPNWSCEAQYSTDNGRSLSVPVLSKFDSDICEIEFTPSKAGKRLHSFSVAGKILNQFSIAVLPREEDHAQVDIIRSRNAHLERETSDNFFEVREENPYKYKEYLEFFGCDQKILCLGVRRRDLVGEDYANINNINRVLEKEYPSCKLSKDLVSWKYGLVVVFDLSSFEKNAALKVLKLLADLVEGQHHYRNEANEFAKEREKWNKKEEEAEKKLEKSRKDFEKDLEKLEDDFEKLEDKDEKFEEQPVEELEDDDEELEDDDEELEDDDEELEYDDEELEYEDEELEKQAQELEDYYEKLENGYRIEAATCRRSKLICGRRMHESNEKASDAIFKFYNHNRPQSEIDLHGQRVGNSEKLRELEANLRKENKTPAEIEEKMERERLKRHEAIRKLDERMRKFDHEKAKRDGEDWLEIIDGAGHHSARRGEQKIRPKVKEYLGKKDIKYVEANEGALLITFSEYTGKEPCVADFYCTRCKRKWTSTTSWKGFFQKCYKCDSDSKYYPKTTISTCYPFKLRSVAPERRGENRDFTRGDHRRLCQKCIQLGRDCRQQR